VAWTHIRSQMAIALRENPDADVSDLRRQFKTERPAEHIARVVDEAPPLTDEQGDRLAAILRGGAGDECNDAA